MSKGERVSVELVGGPPWGFRLGGGADFGCALEIAKVSLFICPTKVRAQS